MEFEFQGLAQSARLKRLLQGTREIRFEYGSTGRLERIVDSTGRRISVVEGLDGRLMSLNLDGTKGKPGITLAVYKYDDLGNLIAITNGAGHGYSFAYDKANRMVLQIGRKGFKFRFRYDSEGRCTRSSGDEGLYGVAIDYTVPGRVTKVTRGDRGVWTYFFDLSVGLTQIVDPMGGVRKYLRDETGRVAVELDQNQNATRILYDAAGAPITKVNSLGHRIFLPEDPNTPNRRAHKVAANPAEFEYGRLLSSLRIRLPSTVDLQLLPLSSLAKRLVLVADERSGISPKARKFKVDPLGVVWWPSPRTGRIFDEFGMLIQQLDEFGRLRSWTYDASENVSQYTDFDGSRWSYDNGAWHLLRGLTNPLKTEVRFSYTSAGKVASFTDAGGTCSEYRYDQNDSLIEVKRHGAVRETYERDACGNLLSKCASDGRELLRIEIGPGNLPIKETLASGDELVFQYDKLGRYLLAATKRDTVEFAYDALGNRILDKRNGKGVTHRFDGWQKRSQSVFFDRFIVNYAWAKDNTLVISDPTGKSHQVRFHSHGLVEKFFGNETRETAQYDSKNRCLFKCVERASGTVWYRRYHWSGEGELRRIDDNISGEIRHEYDSAHRLCRRFLGGSVEEYVLDHADNLIGQPGLAGVVLTDGNRLKATNCYTFEYNDRNHIQARKMPEAEVRYFYDSRDFLVRAETPQGLWEAEYDALGRRTRKSWAGGITEYYWNTDQLIAEERVDGRLRLYVYIDPLAVTPFLFFDYVSVDAPLVSGRSYIVFADQIGTPCFVEDEQGIEAWSARVEPFGRAQVTSGSRLEFNFRFPGHYLDPELSLHYNRFRHYDPSIGRYLQSDPWGIAGGFNLYAYPSNPLLHVDVRGLGAQDGDHPESQDENGKKAEASKGASQPGEPENELPTKEEALAQAKRDAGIPVDNEPDDTRIVPLTDRNGKQILDENYQPIYTEEHDYLMEDGSIITIQDHHMGHQFGEGGVGDQGPHFNVRPGDDTRNGVVPGTQPHYPYQDPGD